MGTSKPQPIKQIKKRNKSHTIMKKKLKNMKKDKEDIKMKEDIKKTEVVPKIKKAKYVFPSEAITEENVKFCLNTLQQLETHYRSKKASLFDDEIPIFIEFHCIKIQNGSANVKFVLPNSTVASTGEVCLITPDLKKGRKSDHEPTIEHWEELLRNSKANNVKTILPMRQLRVEYDQFELKRRLLTQHDFIMVDTRVLKHVSHLLGKMFFKKHNMLIPVRINKKGDLKKDIDTGLRTVILRLKEGETSSLIVGHTGMPQKQIQENILSVVQQLDKFPGGEANIRSLFVKFPMSLSLPLYVTLRPSYTTKVPKVTQQQPKKNVIVQDELSTIPGSLVKVTPEGNVYVQKSTNGEDSDIDMDTEEVSVEENHEE